MRARTAACKMDDTLPPIWMTQNRVRIAWDDVVKDIWQALA